MIKKISITNFKEIQRYLNLPLQLFAAFENVAHMSYKKHSGSLFCLGRFGQGA